MKRKALAGVLSVLALSVSAPAAMAVGGPNESGKSGHFNPNSGPCQGPNNQPNCPGPH